jgi:hypothetical protein
LPVVEAMVGVGLAVELGLSAVGAADTGLGTRNIEMVENLRMVAAVVGEILLAFCAEAPFHAGNSIRCLASSKSLVCQALGFVPRSHIVVAMPAGMAVSAKLVSNSFAYPLASFGSTRSVLRLAHY